MTSSLFLKRSTASGTVPTAAELTESQIAINVGDGTVYYRNVTSSLVEPINVGSASRAETASFALAGGSGGGNGGGGFGGDFSGTFSGSVTGTFIGELEATGTLTGTLSGSASFAENASTAVLAVSSVTAITSSNANTASFIDPLAFTAPRPVKTVVNTNPYNVLFEDYLLLIDASSGTLPIDVILPDTLVFMKGPAGKQILITKADAGANNVQVMGSGSQTIIGDATSSLTDQYQGLTLQPSGNVWWVI